ncbi:hypothetical protein L611_003600000290 [Aminobacter sp. J15]|nr:hypothetical protein L611_003600000290 [Aminobacter sp. J15]
MRDFNLIRLLASDGTWDAFEDDWRRQCAELGEDFEAYAGSTFAVVSDLVASEDKRAGVFGLQAEDNTFAAMCQVNKADLPKFVGPVLRTRFITLSPEYDLTDKSPLEYGSVLTGVFTEVLGLAYLDPELASRHIKFHLRSPQDIAFFTTIEQGFRERDIFASIHTRGMWLYISRK